MNHLFARTSLLAIGALALSACSVSVQYPEADQAASSSSEASSVLIEQEASSQAVLAETANVTYTGTVKAAGISVYQQGTHRLEIDAANFLLLEAEDGIDLNGYVNERVEVTGAVRPTEEGGATIMRVEQIKLRESVESSSSSSVLLLEPTPVSSAAPASSAAPKPVEKPVATPPTPVTTSSAAAKPVVASSKAAEPPVAPTPTEPAAPPSSYTPSERVISMSKDNYEASRWTQAPYCNSSASLCIPIHKNWWYKSFQGTVGHLWYVEFSNAEIENVGDGPISLRLVSGSVESKGASENELRVSGNTVTGFRSWTNGTHIQIVADASLRSAVEYLLAHITPAASSSVAP